MSLRHLLLVVLALLGSAPLAAAQPEELRVAGGNCSNYGTAGVNVWALNDCRPGPCESTGTALVNLWVMNEGCARYTWFPCGVDGNIVTDLRSRAGCPPDPVNWEVGGGGASVWLLNT